MMKSIAFESWIRFGGLTRIDGPETCPDPRGHVLARGLALFLGGFTLLNLLAGLHASHFDGNLWWIDLRGASASLNSA